MKKSAISFTMRAAAVACVAVVVSTGCAKKPAPRREYRPLAPEGTLAAAVCETKGLADNPMAQFLIDYEASLGTRLSDIARAAGADVPATMKLNPEELKELKKRELDELRKFDWLAFTVAAPSFTAEDLEGDAPVAFPAMAAVYAYAEPTTPEAFEKDARAKFEECLESMSDEDKADVCKKLAEAFTITDDTVAGVKVKKCTLKETDDTREILQHIKDLEPCYGLYDGTLLIAASSPKAFAGIVDLYAGKAKAAADGALAADMALGGKAQERGGIYGVAALLRKVAGDEAFAELDDEEYGKYLKALRDIRFTGELDGAAMTSTGAMGVSFDDAALASELASLVEGSRGMVSMFGGIITMQAPALNPVLKILNGAVVKAEGDTCAISLSVSKADIEAIDLAAIVEQAKPLLGGMLGGGDDDDEDDGDDDNGDVDMSDVAE